MQKAIAFNEAESEFWYVCSRAPRCNTYYNSCQPLPHQQAVQRDDHTFILNAGGYGSAKTYTTRQLIYKQLFLHPGGQVLVGANVMSQYQQTIQKELEADIPKAFVRRSSTQKQFMELYNGCRLIYRPLDDADKLRSMNLSAFFIIEGSEVNPDAFTQLKSRLRNMAAFHNGKFSGKGVVETNPDAGWVRTDLLDRADVITQHGTASTNYKAGSDPDPSISVHISSSDSNPFLPPDYIKNLCHGKPNWWIERYIYGSFEFANGLCCPKYKDNIVPAFTPPKEWVKLISHDPGLVDPSAFVCAAVDDKNGIVYIYRDRQYKDMAVPELVEHWNKDIVYDMDMSELYTQPIMDGKMHGRRMFTDKQTLDAMWAQYGVYFQPGHIPVKDRLWRMNAYFESGRVKIMDNCENLQREFKDYKYKPVKLGMPVKEEPVDRNNHSIDAFSWILMKLPENPADLMLGAYSSFGRDLTSKQEYKERQTMWMFTDDNEDDFTPLWSMGD